MSDSSLIVMKFGGTSVATEEGRACIAQRIKEHQEKGDACVVVVSAMGRKGEPYATDTLLGLVENLPQRKEELDLLASVGEMISSVVVASELRARELNTEALTGPAAGIFAEGAPQNAAISVIQTDTVQKLVAAGVVPVVCGFQALTETGEIITLGRGGSDTTACALGVALEADAVEIYSDVDGVMTADPRIANDAQVLKIMRADELFQMAKMGSKIVHTPAAELALSSGVSLYVKNTFSNHPGTRVVDIAAYRPQTIATAVAHTHDVSRFIVWLESCEGCADHSKRQNALFQSLAENAISLDMFTPANDKLFFTVADSATKATEKCLKDLSMSYVLSTDLSKVTLVGAGMHGVPGVMAKLSQALADEKIDMYQTSDSHTTISVLVASVNCKRAIAALHKAFNLGEINA